MTYPSHLEARLDIEKAIKKVVVQGATPTDPFVGQVWVDTGATPYVGEVGPPGPPGATGPEGPEGPAGPAGVSGTSVKDVRWTPRPGDVSIDEFSDDVMDAAWVRVDGTAAGAAARVTWMEGADTMAHQNVGTDAGSELHGLMRPLATPLAVGDAIYTCLQVWSRTNNTYAMGGLILADGATWGAGKQVITLNFTSGTTTQTNNLRTFTGYNAQVAEAANAITAMGMPIFIRIVKLANDVWRMDTSLNGVLWLQGPGLTYACVPTHVGLLSSTWGSAVVGSATYEFVRRQAGVT